MRLLGNGQVWLEEGETVPAVCANDDCGHIYQPAPGSMASLCPLCGKTNMHDETVFIKRFHVERKGRDY